MVHREGEVKTVNKTSTWSRWQLPGLLAVAFVIVLLAAIDVEKKKALETEAVPAAASTPTLTIKALRPPTGGACTRTGKTIPGPLKDGAVTPPCGLSFIAGTANPDRYVLLYLHTHRGHYVNNVEMPAELKGGQLLTGNASWSIDLPPTMEEPLELLALVLASDKKIDGVAKWLAEQDNVPDAIRKLREGGVAILLQRVLIEP